MPRPSFDREAIEAKIGRVRSLGLDELRTFWRVTFRSSPPPAFTKDLMARFLCWHFQEQAQGDLDPETAKQRDFCAGGAPPSLADLHGWPIVIGSWTAPMWVSWIGLVAGGGLSYFGLRLASLS
jgi:hypothetical protein